MNDWILWQKACNAMQAEILKEFRELSRKKAICTHQEINELLEDMHHPKMECQDDKKRINN